MNDLIDSRSCNSSTSKNSYSAIRHMSLPAVKQLQYKDKSCHMNSDNGYSSDAANLKQEVTELLERLQELVGAVSASIAFVVGLLRASNIARIFANME